MQSMILRISGFLLSTGLLAGVAQADEARRQAIADFMRPIVPLYLAQAGVTGVDPARIDGMVLHISQAIEGSLDPDCTIAQFRADFCGMKIRAAGSTSMEPTFGEKDKLFEAPIDDRPPKRGDIIFFRDETHHPDEKMIFIKRLIGMPGDKIEIHDGIISVNGQHFDLSRTQNTGTDISGATIDHYKETQPDGPSYLVARRQQRDDPSLKKGDDFGPVMVPPNSYFLMGDNRDNSLDGRFADQFGDNGFIPQKDINGYLATILASDKLERIGQTFP